MFRVSAPSKPRQLRATPFSSRKQTIYHLCHFTRVAIPQSPPWLRVSKKAGCGGKICIVTPRAVAGTATIKPEATPASRLGRLETLIQLRRLYRNLLRAEILLENPSPVYNEPKTLEGSSESSELAAAHEQHRQAAIDEAVETIAEMELTAEELRLGLKLLLACDGVKQGNVVKSDNPEHAEELIKQRVIDMTTLLKERFEMEIPFLPFGNRAVAQAAFDSRNYRFRAAWPSTIDNEGENENSPRGPGFGKRLEKAERVAEQFVAKQLQPAVRRVRETSPEGVVAAVKASATWVGGVWDRLNGTAFRAGADGIPTNLPGLVTTEEQRSANIAKLSLEIDELEKKLQEASKIRESRLRKAGIQGRARIAGELRTMDSEVAAVSGALAVRTLQLELEYIYGALEEEAVDVLGDGVRGNRRLALGRRGSSDEVALLAAEFGLLDAGLSSLATAVDAGEALYVDESDLARLATDIPDMRMRLGLGDTQVFGGAGFSLVKVQLQIKTAGAKVAEGVAFGVRGVRLLIADIGSAGGLFWRAVNGGTLKPREVQAIRRTARDVLTFIPFTIILILPLSPVGHVLVFGFIQRYFPGFFPSQFTNRRQELMIKYEKLKKQLEDARMKAEAEKDELEFARAAAQAAATMVRQNEEASSPSSSNAAKLLEQKKGSSSTSTTAPAVPPGDESDSEGPAAAAVKRLEEEVAAAADSSYCEDGTSSTDPLTSP